MHRRPGFEPAVACAFFALLLTGCRDEPRPAADAPRPAPATSDGLQPLTSRDTGSADASAPPSTLPPGHPPVDATGAPALPADAGGAVTGTVEAAATHKDKVGGDGGALYLIARNGARQIVAVRRSAELKLPQTFQLSGADAMTTGTSFEGPLDITARWSQRGDAMPSPGDVEGTARGVAVGARDVRIVLSEVRK